MTYFSTFYETIKKRVDDESALSYFNVRKWIIVRRKVLYSQAKGK
jgi:hypothetical protein